MSCLSFSFFHSTSSVPGTQQAFIKAHYIDEETHYSLLWHFYMATCELFPNFQDCHSCCCEHTVFRTPWIFCHPFPPCIYIGLIHIMNFGNPVHAQSSRANDPEHITQFTGSPADKQEQLHLDKRTKQGTLNWPSLLGISIKVLP